MIRIWIAAGTLSLGLLATGAIGPAQAGSGITIDLGGGGRISCREGARIETVPVAIKGPDGRLLDTALPKVAIIKEPATETTTATRMTTARAIPRRKSALSR